SYAFSPGATPIGGVRVATTCERRGPDTRRPERLRGLLEPREPARASCDLRPERHRDDEARTPQGSGADRGGVQPELLPRWEAEAAAAYRASRDPHAFRRRGAHDRALRAFRRWRSGAIGLVHAQLDTHAFRMEGRARPHQLE